MMFCRLCLHDCQVLLNKFIDGDVIKLSQQNQALYIWISASGFPVGDGLARDEQALQQPQFGLSVAVYDKCLVWCEFAMASIRSPL